MVQSSYTTDVVIVGGGPAGVATAWVLGKEGINTIILDRKPREQIGDKTCGDALSPEWTQMLYEEVGLPIPDPDKGELAEYCDTVVLIGKSTDYSIIMGSESATVDRLLYGQALLNAVDVFESITILPESKIISPIVQDDTVTGVNAIHKATDKFEVKAKLVVDASGSSGAIRSRLPESMCTKFPRKVPRHQMIVAYREIIELPEEHNYQNGLYLMYEPELLMPGYYWAFSRGPKELNIGLGWMIYDKNRGTNIRDINTAIRERKWPNAKVLRSEGDQIPARLPLPSCVHNGFMTVGDAAAMANPLNGEGHGSALLGGVKAGQFIVDAYERNDFSERGMWEYNRWVWECYGVEHSYGIAIVKFINKFGFNTFDWLMKKKVLQSDDIIKMVNDPDAKLNLVERAMRGFYRPRVLLGLRSTLSHAKEIQDISRSYPDIEDFEEWDRRVKALELKPI